MPYFSFSFFVYIYFFSRTVEAVRELIKLINIILRTPAQVGVRT